MKNFYIHVKENLKNLKNVKKSRIRLYIICHTYDLYCMYIQKENWHPFNVQVNQTDRYAYRNTDGLLDWLMTSFKRIIEVATRYFYWFFIFSDNADDSSA